MAQLHVSDIFVYVSFGVCVCVFVFVCAFVFC